MELIKSIKARLGDQEVTAVNSREIYEYLGLAKGQYSRWVKSAIDKFDFLPNIDFIWYDIDVEGNIVPTAIVSIDMAKELCMISNTPKGKETRRYFLDMEKKQTAPQLTEREVLELAYNRLFKLEQVVTEHVKENKVLTKEIEHRDEVDTIRKNKGHGLLVGDFAKSLTDPEIGLIIKPEELRSYLRDERNFLMKTGSRKNLPYASYVTSGMFYIRTSTYVNNRGEDIESYTTIVTSKGMRILAPQIIEHFTDLE